MLAKQFTLQQLKDLVDDLSDSYESDTKMVLIMSYHFFTFASLKDIGWEGPMVY